MPTKTIRYTRTTTIQVRDDEQFCSMRCDYLDRAAQVCMLGFNQAASCSRLQYSPGHKGYFRTAECLGSLHISTPKLRDLEDLRDYNAHQ